MRPNSQPPPPPPPSAWKVELFNDWMFECLNFKCLKMAIRNVWFFEFLKVWNVYKECLKVWRFEGLNVWRFEGLNFWMFEGLQIWTRLLFRDLPRLSFCDLPRLSFFDLPPLSFWDLPRSSFINASRGRKFKRFRYQMLFIRKTVKIPSNIKKNEKTVFFLRGYSRRRGRSYDFHTKSMLLCDFVVFFCIFSPRTLWVALGIPPGLHGWAVFHNGGIEIHCEHTHLWVFFCIFFALGGKSGTTRRNKDSHVNNPVVPVVP